MADTYEKDLGAKSAITSSDYIRVVGSDNVSYKQPMSYFPTKAAVDALNSKTTDSVSKASSISGGTLDSNALIKVGNTVFGSARVYGISAPANGTFFTIPSGYRPSQPMRVMGYFIIGGVGNPVIGVVDPNGSISFAYSSSQTATQVGFAGSWTTA